MQGAPSPARSVWGLSRGVPAPPHPRARRWARYLPPLWSCPRGTMGSSSCGRMNPGAGLPRAPQICAPPPVIPCISFLELSKSQNDMTSDKQLLATGPRQCTGQSERRSQSDTAINVTTRVFPEATRPPQDHLPAHSRYRFIFPFIL